jgi:hypothetical protein
MPTLGGTLDIGIKQVNVSATASPNSNSITLVMDKAMPSVGGTLLAAGVPPHAKAGTPVGKILITMNNGTVLSGQLLATGFGVGFTIADNPPPPKPPAAASTEE